MRVRIRFAKLGKVRFTSHRDVARIWERGLRRGGLPVAYSEGYSPRPRVSFGLALSTGYESVAEYLDVELAGDPGDLAARLAGCLPVGIELLAWAPLAPGTPSLQHDVVASTWRIGLDGVGAGEVAAAVDAALAAEVLLVERTRKGEPSVDDVRPAIGTLAVAGEPGQGEGGVVLVAELVTRTRALRPAELVAAVVPGAEERRVLRTHQWIERDGARQEPLEAPESAAALPARWAGVEEDART